MVEASEQHLDRLAAESRNVGQRGAPVLREPGSTLDVNDRRPSWPRCNANQTNLVEPAMQMSGIPFGTTDWSGIETTEHKGERGLAIWRTQHFGGIRVRMVEYTPGYLADHWCTKGHILLCLEGELHTELEDGRTVTLRPGMSYQVADDADPHRSHTAAGARLFIVD